MADKTVTLADQEWQQLVAILANATGYMAFQKLLGQLQAQDGAMANLAASVPARGDGLDTEPPDLPLRGRTRAG